MNTKTTYAGRTIVLLILLCITTVGFTQQQSGDDMMKAWTAYMTPGDMHAILSKYDGDWNTEMSMWMDPKAQPIQSKGTCTYKMILGGRYQQGQFKGDFMGQTMEGIGTMGYDNSKKVFQGSWVDNMGTGIMRSEGTYDAATKTLTMKGTQTDFTSGSEMPFRETHKFVDDNTQIMEMYITPNGMPEFKTMEIKFTRKK